EERMKPGDAMKGVPEIEMIGILMWTQDRTITQENIFRIPISKAKPANRKVRGQEAAMLSFYGFSLLFYLQAAAENRRRAYPGVAWRVACNHEFKMKRTVRDAAETLQRAGEAGKKISAAAGQSHQLQQFSLGRTRGEQCPFANLPMSFFDTESAFAILPGVLKMYTQEIHEVIYIPYHHGLCYHSMDYTRMRTLGYVFNIWF
ncbi:MAG: hypothetical protein KAT27_06010, partial [Desulfobacterales bacterium]|nr:hypothetical protein [Desulfobacterales bacterium]